MKCLSIESLGLVVLTVGCGGAERPSYYETSSNAQASYVADAEVTQTDARSGIDEDSEASADTACEDGEVRECRVTLPTVNGVKNCFVGTSVCQSGSFGACLSDEDAVALLQDL